MDAGLCGHCVHCRLVDGARTLFYLCGRAATDPRFVRYPPLPVRTCDGHVEGQPERPGPG